MTSLRTGLSPTTARQGRFRRGWLLTTVAVWPLLLVPSAFSEPLYVDSLLSTEGVAANGGGLSPYGAPVRLPTQISASEIAKVAAAMAKDKDPFADEEFLEFQSLPEGMKGVTPKMAEKKKRTPKDSVPKDEEPAEAAPKAADAPVAVTTGQAAKRDADKGAAEPVKAAAPEMAEPKAVKLPVPAIAPSPPKAVDVKAEPSRPEAPLEAKSLPPSPSSVKASPAPVEKVEAKPIGAPEPEPVRVPPPVVAAPAVAPVVAAAPAVRAAEPVAAKPEDEGFLSFLPSPKKWIDKLLGEKDAAPAPAPQPVAVTPPVEPPAVLPEPPAAPAPAPVEAPAQPAIELSDAELDKAFAPDDVDAMLETSDHLPEVPSADQPPLVVEAPPPVEPAKPDPVPAPVQAKREELPPTLPAPVRKAEPSPGVQPVAKKPEPAPAPVTVVEREPQKPVVSEPAPVAVEAPAAAEPLPVAAKPREPELGQPQALIAPPDPGAAKPIVLSPTQLEKSGKIPAATVPVQALPAEAPKANALAELEKELAQDKAPFVKDPAPAAADALPTLPAVPAAPEAEPKVVRMPDGGPPAAPMLPTVPAEPAPSSAAAPVVAAPAQPIAEPALPSEPVQAAQPLAPAPEGVAGAGEPLDLTQLPKPDSVKAAPNALAPTQPVTAPAQAPAPMIMAAPAKAQPAPKQAAAPAAPRYIPPKPVKPPISKHWQPISPDEQNSVLGDLTRLPSNLSSHPADRYPAELPSGPVVIDRTEDQVTALNNMQYDDHQPIGLTVSKSSPAAGAANTNVLLNQAYRAITLGQTESAITLYKQALERDRHNRTALFGLATAYQKSGQNADAREIYVRIFRLYPDYEEAFNNYLVLVSQEHPLEALAELHRLEQRNPNYAPIHAQLGMLYMRQDDLDLAIEHLTRAVALVPGNLLYRYNLAIALDKRGATKQAIELYEEIVKAGRQNQTAHGYSLVSVQERLSFLRSK